MTSPRPDGTSATIPRTIFFGSGTFALPILERVADPSLTALVAVITAPARPSGRHGDLRLTPVAELAVQNGLPLLMPETLRSEAVLDELRALEAELVVLADYGRLIPAAILEMPRFGALNLHPSLLPRHRGAAPMAATILAGDDRTGVTLMLMDEGLDTGPIVAQRTVALDGTETAPELETFLSHLAADLFAEALPGWLAGETLAQPQSGDGATLTRPLRRADGRLDPALPARQLERQVRAFQPWPGSWTERDGKRLIVWAASLADVPPDAEPGTILAAPDVPILATREGGLRLDEVQPAGRRRMSGAEYLRGRHPSA